MTRYNTLNAKLSNAQLNRVKICSKKWNWSNFNLSSNLIGRSNDETNFLHKLSLINTQISKISKASVNGSSANIRRYDVKEFLVNNL